MKHEPFVQDRRSERDESEGRAPARGAVVGVLLGVAVWLIAAVAVACWKSFV